MVMSKIIVGVDGSEGSNDAVSLASSLAGITGAELMLVNVFPYELHPNRAANPAFKEYLKRDSEDLLAGLLRELGVEGTEVRSVPNPSPAHGLHALAEAEDAALIVVGSTHTGRAGRVLPGSTGERLLHGAPCPVAVAPKGYAQRSGQEHGLVGCGYDGTQSARRALDAARSIASATGSRLRVIRGFKPVPFDIPPGSVATGGLSSYNDDLRDRAAEELDAAVAKIEPAGAEPQLVVGDPGDVLVKATEGLDLLMMGSRGYGPLHAVLVGGVAGRVVREAACPVIVFPRSAGHTDEDSLFAGMASVRG